jgi:hypothetical protein
LSDSRGGSDRCRCRHRRSCSMGSIGN